MFPLMNLLTLVCVAVVIDISPATGLSSLAFPKSIDKSKDALEVLKVLYPFDCSLIFPLNVVAE